MIKGEYEEDPSDPSALPKSKEGTGHKRKAQDAGSGWTEQGEVLWQANIVKLSQQCAIEIESAVAVCFSVSVPPRPPPSHSHSPPPAVAAVDV
mmetsp:Transcript_30889/g.89716  ORF Transcript_30889/g.89716 Transcript_30889/m.89716 type:complete len:93 (-) Transcript_30889:2-280(-)